MYMLYNRRLGQAKHMTSTDIGIEPGAGLSPPHLSIPSTHYNHLSPEVSPLRLEEKEDGECIEVTHPLTVPIDDSTKSQCHSILSPGQLTHITLGITYSIHVCHSC